MKLSPLVERIRLEGLVERQRKAVTRLAEKLQDAEAVRLILEAELERARAWTERPERFPSRGGEASELEAEPGADDPARGQPLPAADEPEATHNEPRTSAAAVLSGTAGVFKGPRGAHMGKPAIDETGKRYGKLSVIERAPTVGKGARWRCGCDCGAETLVLGSELRAGTVACCPRCKPYGRRCSSCGEVGHRAPSCPTNGSGSSVAPRPKADRCSHPSFKDESGKRYGKLAVVGRAPNNANGTAQWRCRCDCGRERVVGGVSLRNGSVKGCESCSPGYGHGRGGPHLARVNPEVSAPASPRAKFTCFLCAGLPHRVEGKRCRGCGLERAEEPKASVTDFTTGGVGNLGRAAG